MEGADDSLSHGSHGEPRDELPNPWPVCGQRYAEEDAAAAEEKAHHAEDEKEPPTQEEVQEMIMCGECPPGMEKFIWESVVEQRMKLDGDWEETAAGAFGAARRGDWAVCTYLAARCFVEHGPESLSVTIDKALDAIWLWAVSPTVLNIPPGHERLWLHVDGSQAAVWMERGVKAFREWFRDEGLRSSELPQMDHAVTDRQRNAMLHAGEWNIERLVQEQHIYQAEWIETDRITAVGEGQLRVLTSAGWAAASFAGGPQGSAEHFSVGKVLELSQLKWSDPKVSCFVLGEGEQIKLRDFVSGSGGDLKECLGQDARLGHVRGGCFQVLAYPLAGDFTKALLRPVESVWLEYHRSATVDMMRSVGSCLVTTFAKAGRWSLVDILLSSGVDIPRVDEEFSEVCGNNATVRRHWMRDLAKVSGGERLSLFEMAFKAPEELKNMLESLQEQKRLPDLSRCCAGQTSLMLAAAKTGRWDIGKMLLELGSEDSGIASVASLLNSPALTAAPRACQELVHLHGAKAPRASTLKEYFERMACGEIMSNGVLPVPWAPIEDQPGLLKYGERVVLGKCTWLGGTSLDVGSRLGFVRLAQDAHAADREADCANDKLVAAVDFLNSHDGRNFPISMSEDDHAHPRRIFLNEPEAPGLWLALVCTATCVRQDNAGRLWLNVPMNSVPYPIVQRSNVRIVAKTPCCRKKLKGVLIHVDGKPAGITDEDGYLVLSLSLGQHRLSAPYQSSDQKVIQVKNGFVSEELFISGAFYLFLQKLGDGKTAVKVTTNRYEVLKAENMLPFVGEARLCGEIYQNSDRVRHNRTAKNQAFAEVLRVEQGTTCGQQLPIHVKPHDSCAIDYEPNGDADEWFQKMRDSECAIALLFSTQAPMTLGYCTPVDIPSPFSACPPLDLPDIVVPNKQVDVLNVRRVSRSSGRAACCPSNARRSVSRRGRSVASGKIPKAFRPWDCGGLRRGELGAGLRSY